MARKLTFIILTTLLIVAPFFIHVPRGEPYNSESQIRVGTTDSVETSLDPANAYDYFGWEMIRSIGSGLVDYAPAATGPSDIIPDLATSWSTSSDGLQWTFTLRQGVKYDDGTEFNATDVKYTFDRNMGIADPNGPFVGIGFSDIIQDVTVVGTFTVRFDLKIPFSPFLSLIGSPECVILDPKYAPMHGSTWSFWTDVILYTEGDARASNPMGLGPYRLSNWTRVAGKDSQMVLVANPNYWNASAGIPKTKNIIVKFYADSTGLELAITAGEIDIAFRQLRVTDINTMKDIVNLKVWQGPSAFIQYLCFQEKYAPFNVTAIRQAVGAAINRTALVNTVFQGQAQNLYSLIPNGMAGHSDAFQRLGDPNYTRTQELLAPFGYNASNKFTFNLWYESTGHYPQSQQQAQVLKASMEESGVITVNLQSLEWATMGNARRAGTMEAFIYGWYPDYIDPDDYIQPFLQTSGGSWLNLNYSNPQMDLLIAWARGNTSDTVRNSVYGQIQTLMVTDSPIIPLYQASNYAVSTSNITGIYLDMSQQLRYWYLQTLMEIYEALHFHLDHDTYGYAMNISPVAGSVTGSYAAQGGGGPVFSSSPLVATHDYSGMVLTFYHDESIFDRSIKLAVGWIDSAGTSHVFTDMDIIVMAQTTHTDVSIPSTLTLLANQSLYLRIYKNEFTDPVTIFWGDAAHDSSFSYVGTVTYIPEYQSVLVFLTILAVLLIVIVRKQAENPVVFQIRRVKKKK